MYFILNLLGVEDKTKLPQYRFKKASQQLKTSFGSSLTKMIMLPYRVVNGKAKELSVF